MARNWRSITWKTMPISEKVWLIIGVFDLVLLLFLVGLASSGIVNVPLWSVIPVVIIGLYASYRLVTDMGIEDDNPNTLSKNDDWDDELSLKN